MTGRVRSTEQFNRIQRLSALGILAFLGTSILGLCYQSSQLFFGVLALGRLGLGFGLFLWPKSNAGHLRVLIVILSILTLAPDGGQRTLFYLLLYLTLDIIIDTTIVDFATEQDAPLEIGWISGCRLAGLWWGLFLKHSGLSYLPKPQAWLPFVSIVILGFWLMCRERRPDRVLPTQLQGFRLPRKVIIEDSWFYLKNSRALWSAVGLLLSSVLTGYFAGPLLPYPLLPPELAGRWLLEAAASFKLMSLGLLAFWILEKFKLETQILTASALLLASKALTLLAPGEAIELVSAGAALGCTLTFTRAILRDSYRLISLFRVTFLINTWTFGSLIGGKLKLSYPQAAWAIQVVLAVAVLALAIHAHRDYQAETASTVDGHQLDHRNRHGDRILDFEASDTKVSKPRLRLWPKLSYWIDIVLVSAPVWFLLICILALSLSSVLHVFEHKVQWDRQFSDSLKVFEAEITMTAIGHRAREEYYATGKFPKDWSQFISSTRSKSRQSERDLDPWKVPYSVESYGSKILIRSAGPDKILDTSDDLRKELNFPEKSE